MKYVRLKRKDCIYVYPGSSRKHQPTICTTKTKLKQTIRFFGGPVDQTDNIISMLSSGSGIDEMTLKMGKCKILLARGVQVA